MYEKTNWIDKETPVSATNMNKMEEGIFDAHASVMRLNDFDNFVLYGPDAPTKIYPTDASHIILTGPPANYTLEVQNAPNNSAKKYIIRSDLVQSTAKLTIAFADGGTSYTLRKGDTLYAITKTIDGVSSHSGFVVNGFYSFSGLPTLRFDGSTSGITYNSRYGYFTRVGNLVTFHVHIALSSKGSATGDVNVSFPFPAAANIDAQKIICGTFTHPEEPGLVQLVLYAGYSSGFLSKVTSSNEIIQMTDSDVHDFSEFYLSGSYFCE